MPRKPRVEFEGAIHHAYVRGNHQEDIFRDDRDRRFFLSQLAITSRRYRWICLTYCLMTNHAHFLIETPKRTLGSGMRRFNSVYATAFNKRYAQVGHLYQGIFGSRVATTDEDVAQLFRYVACNPVRAKLCRTPEEWRWSSHRHLLEYPDGRVEALLGGGPGSRYAELFEPTHPLVAKFGYEDPATCRPNLASLLAGPSRDEGILAARASGYTLQEIASALGVSTTTVWKAEMRGLKKGSEPFFNPRRAG